MKTSSANTPPIDHTGLSRMITWLLLAFVLVAASTLVRAAGPGKPAAPDLWAHENLVAWCVVPFDAAKRGPEERAEMLARLGFKNFAYDWRAEHVPTFDAEIEALKKNNINLLAWWFPFDADDPAAKATLEVFKRHGVHPQLWVMHSSAKSAKNSLDSPDDQEQRVSQNAARIAGLAKLAAPYGCQIGLYNHNGWFGLEDNQLAILGRLKTMGVTGVGLIYNFSHARDPHHDDTNDFPALWEKIKPYVLAVNVTGMRMEGQIIYPSQGDCELDLMRTIQASGWTGPIGLIAEKGGDAEVTLKNYLTGLDWLARELQRPGSGGPHPFPSVP